MSPDFEAGGSWSGRAPEATDKEVVDIAGRGTFSIDRTLKLRNSGNVDGADVKVEVELLRMEWFATTGPCPANLELEPQPRGVRPRLSALIMPAA